MPLTAARNTNILITPMPTQGEFHRTHQQTKRGGVGAVVPYPVEEDCHLCPHSQYADKMDSHPENPCEKAREGHLSYLGDCLVAAYSGHGALAINSGILGPRKSVNFPGIDLPHLPSVTEKDREAILAAPAAGVNIIAHSFVRTAADVEAVREVLRSATDDNSYPSDILVYAKIECRMALDHLDEIMDAADGILFARGDLGAAVPIEQIPVIQQQVMERATRRGLPVILSTQILQSMLSSDTPTRAEVTDMYLGVIQGASWMLLCGETAQGNYPAECIDIMRRTIDATTTYLLPRD